MRAAVLGLTLGAAGILLPGARAEVVVTALPERQVLFTDFPAPLYDPIDLNGDSVTDFTFGYDSSGVGLRTERANRVVYDIDPPPNIGGSVQRLPEGFLIGSALGIPGIDWRSADLRDGYVSEGESRFVNIVLCLSTGCSSTWPAGPSHRGYIGLEFELDDGVHYGYFDVSVSGSNPATLLYGWAYESIPNIPISTVAVPEPSTWALIILGGVLFAYTRHNQRKG
jgi:hypothetical protein